MPTICLPDQESNHCQHTFTLEHWSLSVHIPETHGCISWSWSQGLSIGTELDRNDCLSMSWHRTGTSCDWTYLEHCLSLVYNIHNFFSVEWVKVECICKTLCDLLFIDKEQVWSSLFLWGRIQNKIIIHQELVKSKLVFYFIKYSSLTTTQADTISYNKCLSTWMYSQSSSHILTPFLFFLFDFIFLMLYITLNKLK